MSNVTTTVEIKARCVAFSGEAAREHRVAVEFDGDYANSVRVWDSVAGHYTTCHSLTGRAKARLIRLAREAR